MQASLTAPIELIYPTTRNRVIYPYQLTTNMYRNNRNIKQYNSQGELESPKAFIWHDSHLRPITPKLIDWIDEIFKPLFVTDKLTWAASVSTASPKLQPYLKDLPNE